LVEGRHALIISAELFDQAQTAISKRTHKRGDCDYVPYALHGLVYCYHCEFVDKPNEPLPSSWTAMHHRKHYTGKVRRQCYCDRISRGHGKCPTVPIDAQALELLVIDKLIKLFSANMPRREQALQAFAAQHSEYDVQQRFDQLRAITTRMDQRYDLGFINPQTYLTERAELQAEIAKLTPLLTSREEMMRAVTILNDFAAHWQTLSDDAGKQNEFLSMILYRVFMHPDGHLLLEFTPAFHMLTVFEES